jgi:biotin transport system substrate-specific component
MAVLAGTILGKKNGTIAVLLYVAAGLAGLPVFVQGGGIGYFAVPTFGYLIGFIFGAFLSGWIAEGGGRAAASTAAATAPPRFGRLLLANLAGLVPIYLVGVPYLYFALNVLGGGGITPTQALVSGLAVCLPGDMLLCLPISYIALRIKKLRLK